MRSGFFGFSLWCMLATPLNAGEMLPAATTTPVDFERHIAPLLQKHCLKCHRDGKEKGGLRLDDRTAMLKGGNSGPILEMGKSDRSRLIHLIAGTDAEERMPPDGEKLTAQEVSLFRGWIDQGLKWGQLQVKPEKQEKHWAFQPVQEPGLPRVAVPHPIDRWIQARLIQEKLNPNPEAAPETLVRRLYLDLIGLPPTTEEIDKFIADTSSNRYEKLVDYLLSNAHFGERWGRYWLDAARYADSDGYEKDSARPYAWRYRDWVIKALNRDLPYNQFVIEQLAGDQLPNATIEQKIATGFHRNTLTNKEGGVDQEEFRVQAVMDRVSTTSKVFLGVTIACAQCHDHKFDPFSQREFYQLFAFFNRDQEVDIDLNSPSGKQPVPKKGVIDPLAKAPILQSSMNRKTHLFIKGDFLRPGVEVQPGTPAVLGNTVAATTSRLNLAQWIASEQNPLTRRVFVNWVWSHLFGRGLVFTLEDFGTQGEKPSHPELLDYLAVQLSRSGWSLKKLIRLIVTSDTYKQSSKIRADHRERDPRNVLLARQSRLRLEAEVIRDQALALSGLLNRTIGGPSIKPPQPAGISELTYASGLKWVESPGAEKYRRGLYIWFQRTSPFPMLMTFDASDSNVCAVKRERSNTPLQALTLLNDTVFHEAAVQLGKKWAEDTTPEQAFRQMVGRDATLAERARLTELQQKFHQLYVQQPDLAKRLTGQSTAALAVEQASWIAFARTLLNLDEVLNRE